MIWTWCGGHPDWSEEKWSDLLYRLVQAGISGVLLGGTPAQVRRIAPVAKSAGLAVHAWMWTFCRPSDEIAEKHLDWFQVSRDGKSSLTDPPYVGYYKWLCPSNEDSVQHILKTAEALAVIPEIDAVHMDYVRFPDVILAKGLQPKYGIVQDREYPQWDFCYCKRCVAAFEMESGIRVNEADDPSSIPTWKEFRYSLIKKAVHRVRSVSSREGKQLSAAVFPHPELARLICRQSWDDFDVDMYFPMTYQNFYEESIDWIGEACSNGVSALRSKGKESALYAGLYLPSLTSEGQFREAIEAALSNGADGVSLFDAENLLPYHFKALASLNSG
mmetsp:Transcript_44296/g.172367  ORF Transcript_44296/g.172367 Transcript_44296/m.172367 type:complete len:331 (-) Transcript_44296:1321-2313(-)|eukprot:CAMPEP_0113955186 /NCGR_PEP_ID=MMETSP0011_2-20120614/1126_1 /TAXON_ID=101924 /ORGANISM="Rhodosorus marinus" /LENGTH=330 /DNA_ID=CAMNT_0000964713 /DNA_START=676 /DNA_END=1668 /DNA_ORIENTATION=+ /assembly_acc=CAM_ASM_000156